MTVDELIRMLNMLVEHGRTEGTTEVMLEDNQPLANCFGRVDEGGTTVVLTSD